MLLQFITPDRYALIVLLIIATIKDHEIDPDQNGSMKTGRAEVTSH
jgi:hypothetical protein